MKNKKLFLSLTAVVSAVVFLGIFVLIWFCGDIYKDFKRFNKEIAIEGLDDGAVPQGLASYYASYTDGVDASGNPLRRKQAYFLQSAYMTDGSPSRIYVTGLNTGYVGYVTLVNEDGTPHTGHVGGIATNGARLWIAYKDSVLVATKSEEYKTENILSEIIDKASKNNDLPDGEKLTIQITASFKANCNVAFLYYYDDPRYVSTTYDRLYVGEFYRKGNYETDKNHRFKTPNGYKNTAFMYEYNVDSNNDNNRFGLTRLDSQATSDKFTEENNVPKIQRIFSLPEMIQGIAFSGRAGYSTNDGQLILSQSYGLSNSHLLCFDWGKVVSAGNRKKYTELIEEKTGKKDSFVYKDVYETYGDRQKPYSDNGLYVYFVDKGNKEMFTKDYSIPSMSEGMCNVTRNDQNQPTSKKVYVLFESASKKYKAFTRERLKHVYSFTYHG